MRSRFSYNILAIHGLRHADKISILRWVVKSNSNVSSRDSGSGTGSSVSVVNRSSTADVVSRVCEVQAEQTARSEAERSLGSPTPLILENEGQPSLSGSESGTISDSNIGPNTQLKEQHTATSRPQPGLIPECANQPVFSAFPQRNFGKQQRALSCMV